MGECSQLTRSQGEPDGRGRMLSKELTIDLDDPSRSECSLWPRD